MNSSTPILRGQSFLLLIVVSCSAFSLLVPSTALAQTTWFKYEGNPVMDVGRLGEWDGAWIIPSRVLYEDSIYKMWYSGYYGARSWQIGLATSPDGIAWKRHRQNPVLKPGDQPWDSAAVAHGYVIHENSLYQLWYNGGNAQREGHIGFATSPDGISWTRGNHGSPVVSAGTPGSWDSRLLSRPSVLGPDDSGQFKMWFAGEDSMHIGIGFASGRSVTSWVKHLTPVLTSGSNGSWDDRDIFFPRVLSHRGIYEMWYGGHGKSSSRRVGYAMSPDGIHWTKSPQNPVLNPGRDGAWDSAALLPGDVLFDRSIYHMWYAGLNVQDDLGAFRIGYAISPEQTEIAPVPRYIARGTPILLSVKTGDQARLKWSAVIHKSDGTVLHAVNLLDDGNHGDNNASDGVSANTWSSSAEEFYFADIRVEYRKRLFVLNRALTFTTAGPIEYDGVELAGDAIPHPGDSLLIRVNLRNGGISRGVPSVEASLFSLDSTFARVSPIPSLYGDIAPGQTVTSSRSYKLFITPECPSNTDIRLAVSVSSMGEAFWSDVFTLRVLPPWWQSQWAFALYALFAVGFSVGTVRYVEVRKLRQRIDQLERERVLERERERISQDMHDDVGARLTEIGILSELAKKEINDPGKVELQIQKISDSSREVIASISEIIWAINSQNASLDDLVAYLREYTSKFLGTTTVASVFESPETIPTLTLSGQTRRNIFLVVKETLNNIVKHSAATEVRISVEFQPHTMEIIIADNGIGFDSAQSTRFGNGLRNMKKRMGDIGGSFEISSTPGRGTRTVFRMNL